MSKRFIFPQQNGIRKKPKLDVTVSDHNFPLSQNVAVNADSINTWEDEVDDEMLLLASQACEEAISGHNISELPNYSVCMDPPTTSTQIQSKPSNSRSCFQFKVPSSNLVFGNVSSNDKYERISSPLPGISKVCKVDNVNISDDIIFNNKICKGQDSDQVYRQLLQLKEENEKLKSENGKLLEKCVTKEGEASILRTQLKTCQMAVDNARMDKIKAQEKVQIDWSEKLSAANKQLNDLRTQLDFKNLEIISVKEKCKLLESNKVKLTQVRKAGNDSMLESSNNYIGINDTQSRRAKKTSSSAQTEDKSHFLKLNIGFNREHTKLTEMLPFIMDSSNEQCSILEYNEKLKQPQSSNKCRIYTTFHRLPSTSDVKQNRPKINLSTLYEDLSYISTAADCDLKKCLHIMKRAKDIIQDVQYDLENIQQRMTTAFTKEMDEIYMDLTNSMVLVCPQDLLSGKALYKEEQGIQARRITAVLVYILEDSRYRDVYDSLLDDRTAEEAFIDLINRICVLLDLTSTAALYSGLILSFTLLLEKFMTKNSMKVLKIIKNIILSRPMGFVICKTLQLMGMWSKQHILQEMCHKGSTGNLKPDHEQGVLLYKRDSCTLQVALKQIETALKCIEKQYLVAQAVECGRGVLKLFSELHSYAEEHHDKSKCECQSVLLQVMVYALKICTEMWKDKNDLIDAEYGAGLQAVCQGGVQVVYCLVSCDSDSLASCEGHLLQICEAGRCTDTYSNMISEIICTIQSATEEAPQTTASSKQAWINSFQKFSIAE